MSEEVAAGTGASGSVQPESLNSNNETALNSFSFGYGDGVVMLDPLSSIETPTERLTLGASVEKNDIYMTAEGPDLVIYLLRDGEKTGDKLVMMDGAFTPDLRVSELAFEGGEVLAVTEFSLQFEGSDIADVLTAISGFNVDLQGGTGDDTLYGNSGSNRYFFNRGDGHDTLRDSGSREDNGSQDTVVFGEGIRVEDVRLEADGSHFRLTIQQDGEDIGDAITLQYANASERYGIEKFVFADGHELALSDLIETVRGTDGDDQLTVQHGSAGDFFGGRGDDVLQSTANGDRFHFDIGDGRDLIRAIDGGDSILFGDGIVLDDIAAEETSEGIVLTIGDVDSGDSITLTGTIADQLTTEQLQFADGEVVALQDLLIDETVFRFNREDGQKQLILQDDEGREALYESILLGWDISPEDLRVSASDSHDGGLTLTLLQDGEPTGDQLTLPYALYAGYSLDMLQFRDGSSLSLKELPVEHHGSVADDSLSGVYGRTDAFYGGEGDDQLTGSFGEDRFHFSTGDGQDRIAAMSGSDRIVMAEGIRLDDLSAEQVGDDILIRVKGVESGDSITVLSKDSDSLTTQSIQLSDSTEITLKDLLRGEVQPGGEFVFSRGDGPRQLDDDMQTGSGQLITQINFGENISPSDLRLIVSDQNESALVLTLLENGVPGDDQLTLSAALNDGFDITTLAFADGSTLAIHDLAVEHIGDDSGSNLAGVADWADRFTPSGGNDEIIGSTGIDQLIFNTGDDRDSFHQMGADDQIVFGTNISPDDLRVEQDGDDISISVLVNGYFVGDEVRVMGHSADSLSGQSLVFDDGSTVVLKGLLVGGQNTEGHRIERGEGEYRISLDGTGSDGTWSTILFADGIADSDLHLLASGDDLVLQLRQGDSPTDDQVVLEGAAAQTGTIDTLIFSNESRLALSDLTVHHVGDVSENSLAGVDGHANVFAGNAGNDTLQASDGADQFHFERGDDQDSISGLGDDDQLVFGSDISQSDLNASVENGDTVIRLLVGGHDSGDQIILQGKTLENLRTASITFDDGSSVAIKELLVSDNWVTHTGTDQSDELHAEADTNNRFYGLEGDDTLHGGDYIDHFHIARGCGRDTLLNLDDSDQIIFGDGISYNDIQLTIEEDNVVLSILNNGTDQGDQVVLTGTAHNPEQVQSLVFLNDDSRTLVTLLADRGYLFCAQGTNHTLNAGDVSQIVFDNDITYNDIDVNVDGDDVVLNIAGGGSVTLVGGLYNTDMIENVYFAGDTDYTLVQLIEAKGYCVVNAGDTGVLNDGDFTHIVFDNDITYNDVDINIDGDDVVINIVGGGNVTLVGGLYNTDMIQNLYFAGDTDYTLVQLIEAAGYCVVTPGETQVINAGDFTQVIFDNDITYNDIDVNVDGDDVVLNITGGGSVTLVGGLHDTDIIQALYFAAGNSYTLVQLIQAAGYCVVNQGDTTVINAGDYSQIVFDNDITYNDIDINIDGDDVVINIAGGGNVTLVGGLYNTDMIQNLYFAGDTDYTLVQLIEAAGYCVVTPGETQVINTGDFTQVIFDNDITYNDIDVNVDGDDVVLNITGGGSVTLVGGLHDTDIIQALYFAAGNSYTLVQLIQAAGYCVVNQGDTTVINAGDYSQIVFDNDITYNDIDINIDGDDVVINIAGGGNVTLVGGLYNTDMIQNLYFAGDTDYTLVQLIEAAGYCVVTPGETQVINAGDFTQVIFDNDITYNDIDINISGDDVVLNIAGGGSVTLVGGLHDTDIIQALYFAAGNSYTLVQLIQAAGYCVVNQGDTTVINAGDYSQIVFANDITYNNIDINIDGDDVVINIAGGGSVTLVGGLYNTDMIQHVYFAGATDYTLVQLIEVAGYCVVNRGDTTVVNAGDFTQVIFDNDITYNDIDINIDGDDVVLNITGGGSVTLVGGLHNTDIIQTLHFADHDDVSLVQLIQATGYCVVNRGDTTVINAGDYSQIVFDNDITYNDIDINIDGDDVVINIAGGGSVTLVGGLYNTDMIQNVYFVGDTDYTLVQLIEATGYCVVMPGETQVINAGDFTQVIFDNDITYNDIDINIDGDDVVLNIAGGGSVTFVGGLYNTDIIQQLYFADGDSYSLIQILDGNGICFVDTDVSSAYDARTFKQFVFDGDIGLQDVTVSIDGPDIVLNLPGDVNISLLNGVNQLGTLKQLVFSDGSSVRIVEAVKDALVIRGTEEADVLQGPQDRASLFEGRQGDDHITGTEYSDCYYFNKGDGADRIITQGGYDQVSFGEGISPTDLRLSIEGNDLVLYVQDSGEDTSDSLHIVDGALDTSQISYFSFSDGMSISLGSLVNYVGDNGTDILQGREDNSGIFIGGRGSDVLRGSTEVDHYLFNRGDGVDTIVNAGGDDCIRFGDGIALSDIRVRLSGDDIEIDLLQWGLYSGDRLVIENGAANPALIDQLIFADGNRLSLSELVQKVGTVGADTLDGSDQSGSIFMAGQGDDLIISNDSYQDHIHYAAGDGHDTLQNLGGGDRIIFGEDITPESINIVRTGDDLTVHIGEGSDAFTINDGATSTDADFRFVFSDAVEQSVSDYQWQINGTDGVDSLVGQTGNGSLFHGKEGDDSLTGFSGDDTYYFKRGDGADRITDSGGLDRIQFSGDINESDIQITLSGRDIVLSVLQNDALTDDSLTLENALNSSTRAIEQIVFDNGNQIELGTLLESLLTIEGTPEGDELVGIDGQSAIFIGKEGRDNINGKSQGDIYHFKRGDGQDDIRDQGGVDYIRFAEGINPQDIHLYAVGSDLEMQIWHDGQPGGDSIRLISALQNDVNLIETLLFADGTEVAVDSLALNQQGTENADSLNSVNAWSSVFDGRDGNDQMHGSQDGDLYIFNRGDGADTITETGGSDRILLGGGIDSDDLVFGSNGTDLVISVLSNGVDTGDQIVIKDALQLDVNKVEFLEFEDSTVLDIAEITAEHFAMIGTPQSDSLTGVAGKNNWIFGRGASDTLKGAELGDRLYGEGGVDQLYGESGNDHLIGGAGNDSLYGGTGADSYYIGMDTGYDYIYDVAEAGVRDRIVLGEGVSQSDVRLTWYSSSAIKLNLLDDNGEVNNYLLIEGKPSYGDYRIEDLAFSDGSVVALKDYALEYHGTTGNNSLSAHSDNHNAFFGGQGKDTLTGRAGRDDYHFSRGDGVDTIVESGGSDRIVFGVGISTDDVRLGASGNDLILWIMADGVVTADKIVLQGARAQEKAQVELLQFADGETQALSTLLEGPFHHYSYAYDEALTGSLGETHYHIGLDTGNDTVVEVAENGVRDRIVLGEEVSQSDVRLTWYSSSAIKLNLLKDSGEVNNYLLINSKPSDGDYRIEDLAFSDGSVVALKDYALEYHGTTGNNSLSAHSDNHNAFFGGQGKDTLTGRAGRDDYHFSRGDGVDTIVESGGSDRIVFGAGISTDDVRLGASGNDLILWIMADGVVTADKIVLQGARAQEKAQVELLQFADGETLALSTLQEGPFHHYSYAYDEALTGSLGETHYHIGLDTGNDTVVEVAENGVRDRIVLGEGVSQSDVRLTWYSSSAIQLNLLDDDGEVNNYLLIDSKSSQGDYRIEDLAFSDGSVVALKDYALEYHGTTGNNSLSAHSDNHNAFFGGQGKDTLTGRAGRDDYHFSRGDGVDTIVESGGSDRIVFGAGISTDDVRLGASGNDLILWIMAEGAVTADRIVLQGARAQASAQVELLQFADGETQALSTLQEGPFHHYSYAYDEALTGSLGETHYHIGLDTGNDTVVEVAENGVRDRIVLGEGVSQSDVRLTWYSSSAIQLNLLDDDGEVNNYLLIDSKPSDGDYRIEDLAFSDGSVVALKDYALEYHGTTGNNSLSAHSDNHNAFFGGQGKDTLTGRAGRDDYHFSRGDGVDTIVESGGSDRIVFGAGISTDDVRLGASGNDLILWIMADGVVTADKIVLQGARAQEKAQVELLQFADGETLALSTLQEGPFHHYSYAYDEALTGSLGETHYHIGLDTGNDTVVEVAENGVRDRIVLGEEVSQSDVRLTWYSSSAIKLNLLDDDGEVNNYLLINSKPSDGDYRIEDLAFSDGSVVALKDYALEYHGTTGNNSLSAHSDNHNAFFGGQGKDTLTGRAGRDDYHFSRGDGVDTIVESGGSDRIVFGAGISTDDVRLGASGNDLILWIMAEGAVTADRIVLQGARAQEKAQVELLQFADGETLALSTLQEGPFHHYSYAYDEALTGSLGETHYHVGLDTGNDTVVEVAENGVRDRIVLGEEVSQSDVRLTWYSSSAIKLNLLDDNGEVNNYLLINSKPSQGDYRIEDLAFSDGSVVALKDYALEYHGTTGNNSLSAHSDNHNAFFGGQGKDTLSGKAGRDDYHFNRGDGADTIIDTGGNDQIIFGEGVLPDGVKLVSSGNDLVVQLWDNDVLSSDSITLSGALTDENKQVESFEFADGTETTLVALIAQSEDSLL